MRKFLPGLLLLIPFAVAACGGGAGAAPTVKTPGATGTSVVNMNATDFVPAKSTVTISAGQAVTFADSATNGGLHYLVTGTNGTFKAAPGAPAEFNVTSGIVFNAGDTKSITFPNAGTFLITCTIHPYMLATIVVTW